MRGGGRTPVIAGRSGLGAVGPALWARMFLHVQLRGTHKRSNVESTVSMLKAKFRDHLRS